jgi:hypothetical protein
VKAVAITLAVQVVTPPRRSETVTAPSAPLMVADELDVVRVPRETLPVGALIVSVPDVSVNVAVVAAETGVAPTTPLSKPKQVASTIHARMVILLMVRSRQPGPAPTSSHRHIRATQTTAFST